MSDFCNRLFSFIHPFISSQKKVHKDFVTGVLSPKKIFSLNNACLAEQQYCWSLLVTICLRLATVMLVLHSFKMFKDTLDVPSISMIYKTCWYFIFISIACISTMSYISNYLLLGLIIAVLIAQNPEIIWLCTHNNIIHWALTCGIHIDDSNLNPTNHIAGSGCQ